MTQVPNILLLILDSVRADHLGCYGYFRPTSPNLDRLAREGARFSLAVSPAAGTISSLPSILTGRSVPEHGVGPLSPRLPETLETLAEWLRNRNLETFGLSANPYFGAATGMDRGFLRFEEVGNPRIPFPPVESVEIWSARILRALITYRFDKGARAIVGRARKLIRGALRRSLPFFGVLHFMDAHAPYLPPSPFFERFLSASSQLKRERLYKKLLQRLFDHQTSLFILPGTGHSAEDLRSLYDGGILYLDSRIGELVDWLDREGILQNTLLVVTADHGENLGDHGFWGHGHCLYDSLLRVPLILRYPERVPVAHVEDTLVQSHDIFPTIKILLDQSQASPQDNQRALLPEWIQKQHREYAFSADPVPGRSHLKALGLDVTRLNRSLLAVRTRRAKWIESSDGHHEFYDLGTDASELQNLYPGSHPELALLRDTLAEWKNKTQSLQETKEASFNPAVRDRLRDLGYFH